MQLFWKGHKLIIITLIKNDYKFAAAYFVLGDILLVEGQRQLALRAYHRANNLDEDFWSVTYGRIEQIKQYWEDNKKNGYIIEIDSMSSDSQLNAEIKAAKTWLNSFRLTNECSWL